MLHRVEVRVVQVSRKVSIIADRVLPVPPLPMPRSPWLVIAGDRDSRAGKAFENAVLIVRQRPGKSAWPAGKVHRHSIWSGRTTQVSMWKGAWSRTCRITSRRA
jgi:hypothetical protein